MLESRRGLWVVTALVVAAFGPYIAGGIRTEQLAAYSLAAILTAAALPLMRPPVLHLVGVMATWALLFSVALIGAISPPPNLTPWARGSAVAGLDNFALPLAVILVVLALCGLGANPSRLLDRVCSLLVIAMVANTAAAFMQMGGYEWTPWWGSDSSTAIRAAANGRFSGIINQPAEAGVLYGVALLAALYRLRGRTRLLPWVIVALVVGGMLTVSKVFLLIGLPSAAWNLMRMSAPGRLAGVAVWGVGALAVVQSGMLPGWTGADQLRNVLPNDQRSILTAFTAGRYGEGGTVGKVSDAVLEGPRWFGFGAGGVTASYDSGYIEAIAVAGLFGLACMVAAFLILGRAWMTQPQGRQRQLFGLTVLLCAAANFGIPALTANRVATIVWLILTLSLAASASEGGTWQGRRPGVNGVVGEEELDHIPGDPQPRRLRAQTERARRQ